LNNYITPATKAVQKCLQNYAVFQGRASRSEFWYFFIFYVAANFLGNLIADFVGSLVTLGLLLPYLAVAVRRMHDRNKAGWYVLVPLFNIYLLATPGDSGNNRFGAKPEKF
jgi:uncharacterized membrane protein YhaH (DUF805 family)